MCRDVSWYADKALWNKTAETAKGNEFMKLPLITSETHTEWKTFQHYFLKEQEGDTKT